MYSIRIWAGILFLLLAPGFAATAVSLPATELQKLKELESDGKVDEAIAAYETLIRRYPEQAELHNNLAVLMARAGRLEQAREQLEKAMHTDPVYAAIYENLSAVYVEMARGSYSRALQLGVAPKQVELRPVELARPTPATVKAASATVSAAPSPAPVSTPPQADTQAEAIRLVLQGWASAWSAQEVDLYLSFYAPEFRPAQGMSRDRWQRLRRERLQRPAWVKVRLEDLQVQKLAPGQARVRFLQHYQSDTYRDQTRKEIVLKSSPDGWRIVSERSL